MEKENTYWCKECKEDSACKKHTRRKCFECGRRMGHGHFMKGHYSSEYTNACVDCFRRWRSEYNANKLIESIVTKCVDERLLPRENIDFKVLNFDEDDGFAKNIQFVIVGTTKKDKGFSAFGFNYLNPWGYPKKQASVA